MSGSWVSSVSHPTLCLPAHLALDLPLPSCWVCYSCLTFELRLAGKPLELYFPFVAMQLPKLFGLGTKWVWISGAFYLRLVGRPLEVYQYLEPLYNDYRKVRLREADGSFALTHMDEVVDQLLNNEYLFDIALPRIPNRWDTVSKWCCCVFLAMACQGFQQAWTFSLAQSFPCCPGAREWHAEGLRGRVTSVG